MLQGEAVSVQALEVLRQYFNRLLLDELKQLGCCAEDIEFIFARDHGVTMTDQPFKLQQPGKITAVDSLRLAAKALEMAADDVEAMEKDPTAVSRSIAEIETTLRSVPPLINAIVDGAVLSKGGNVSPPHPAIAAIQALDNDGKPIE